MPTVRERAMMSMTVKRLLQQSSKLVIQDGMLYKRMIDPSTHELHLQIICPASRQEEVWKRYHDASAHAGVARTLSRLHLLAKNGGDCERVPSGLCQLWPAERKER